MSRKMNITRILMVCLGNICRSPLAEGIMQSKLPKERFIVDSAGTAGYHIGASPDIRSVAVAKKYGLNISYQKGRQFQVEDFDEFDHIFVMDNSNYSNVIKLARNTDDIAKVTLMLDCIYPDQNKEVPDPYYGGDRGFEEIYHLLDQACNIIAKRLA